MSMHIDRQGARHHDRGAFTALANLLPNAAPAALTLTLLLGAPATVMAQEGSPKQDEPAQDDAGQDDAAQDDEAKKKELEEKDREDLNPFKRPGAGGEPGGQDEMAELFIKVDKRLRRVSELLYEASTGDPSRASEIGNSGIDELIRGAEAASGAGAQGIAQLLEATRMQSEAAKTEIDRILEIASQNQSSSSSGQSNKPPEQSGEMPQQGQTPSGSRKEEKGGPPEGSKPQDQQQQSPTKDGEQPMGPEEQKGSEDRPGDTPPQSATGDAADASGNQEWGDLPVHLRKVFQNGISDDVPPRYRDWVDSYYKRLNRRGGR